MISQCTMHGNDSCSKLDQVGNSVFITMPSWKAEDEGLFEASRVNFDASKLSIEFTYNTISRYNLPIQKLDLQIPQIVGDLEGYSDHGLKFGPGIWPEKMYVIGPHLPSQSHVNLGRERHFPSQFLCPGGGDRGMVDCLDRSSILK